MHIEYKWAVKKRDKVAAWLAVLEKLQAGQALTESEQALLAEHINMEWQALANAEQKVRSRQHHSYCNHKSVGYQSVNKIDVQGWYTTERDYEGLFWGKVEARELLAKYFGIPAYKPIKIVEKGFKTRKAAETYARKQFATLSATYRKPAKKR